MPSEIDSFREFFQARSMPPTTLRVDCAWVAQQPSGTATHIMACIKIVEEWKNARRKETGASD
jgi:hypothetical protein